MIPGAAWPVAKMEMGSLHMARMGFFSGRAAIIAATLVVTLSLAGCQTTAEEDYVEKPVGELYNKANGELKAKEYKKAAKSFEEVERQHPYSEWAKKSILMSAYSYYEASDYQSAIASAKRYIGLYPGSEDAPYAQYIVATSYYEQIVDVGRDQDLTEQALKELNEVVRKYPDSDYARDARLKMDLARNHLAGKEMEIGRYYLKQRAYIAAINRFKVVVEKYQTTSQIEEALARLTESYMALGVYSEAQTAAAVLGFNYPGSKWYEDSYVLLKSDGLAPREDRASWISRAWRSVSRT